MAKKKINESTLVSIANAIRAKLGVETEYKPTQMPSAIQSIETPAHKELSITANGVYEPPTGYNGFSRVTANVLSAQPTGNIDITNMQVVDVSDYATAQVVDSDLVAGNIKKDVDILGIVGTFEGGGGGSDDWTGLTDYIESNGTQYINTGYSVKDNSRFEVIANPSTSQPSYSTIFGTRSSNADNPQSHSCVLATTWSSNLGNVNWGSGINRVTSLDKGNKTKYVVRKDRYVVMLSESIDDVIGVGATNSSQSATEQPLFLFTLGANGSDYGASTHCNMKLYRFRIYESDTLVHEFVPWTDTNDVVCLKDTVTGDLLYNAGTGTFTRGTDEVS